LNRLDVLAADCVFIGEAGSGELHGAHHCGITTVMVTSIIKELWPEKIEERKKDADFVIEHLSEPIADDGGLHNNRNEARR